MKNMKSKWSLLFLLCIVFPGQVIAQDDIEKINLVCKELKFKNLQSIEIKSQSGKLLDVLAFVVRRTNCVYEIQSYSSSRGKAEENLVKTQKRAEVIKAELVKRGIDSKRLFCKGFGEANRIYTSPTRSGQIRNERISIIRKVQ